ncbi:MAG: nucleotide exchange factor GrpE [Hyphomicrobiales bacterium]|nr:nucleotide exchange factor GrpE [Hyphomicrobiales bacterium]
MAGNSTDKTHGQPEPNDLSHAGEPVEDASCARDKKTLTPEPIEHASHQTKHESNDGSSSSIEHNTRASKVAEEKIAQLEGAKADLEDRLKRAIADQENSRKRTEREAQTAVKFAASAFAADLLPTLDNLHLALSSVANDEGASEPLKRLFQGVKATERVLLSALQKHGIRRLDPLGEPFNPNHHEVVSEVERNDLPSGAVAQVLQPGYLYHDRLLRPAMVSVAKSGSGVGSAASDNSRASRRSDSDRRP